MRALSAHDNFDDQTCCMLRHGSAPLRAGAMRRMYLLVRFVERAGQRVRACCDATTVWAPRNRRIGLPMPPTKRALTNHATQTLPKTNPRCDGPTGGTSTSTRTTTREDAERHKTTTTNTHTHNDSTWNRELQLSHKPRQPPRWRPLTAHAPRRTALGPPASTATWQARLRPRARRPPARVRKQGFKKEERELDCEKCE